MLDENLPAFFLKPSSTGIKHHRDVYSSHHGSDPLPTYSLQNLDPASALSHHKNCYAAALFDAHNPEVLFGEVIARPSWSYPTLSAEEIRRNNGIAGPPQPILPPEFLIQLYNPDQQARVEVREGKWGGSHTYEFSMPMHTFRTPSASNLDRGQSDPGTLAITPKIQFVWRKESKLSKDLTCFMTGRSTDTHERKKLLGGVKGKDPDIAVALWRGLREMTLYESNMARLEMEDPKGLEVVLLLGAIVIRDLYFHPGGREGLREIFNLSDAPGDKKLSGGGRKLSNPSPYDPRRVSTIPAAAPIPDARTQWALDAETARLAAQNQREAKAQAIARQQREKADEKEARRLQNSLELDRKRKQEEIDRETERLRKEYGVGRASESFLRPIPQGRVSGGGMYGQPSASASSVMMSGGNGNASLLNVSSGGGAKKKKSFFGLRSVSDDDGERRRLNKKSSTYWT